MSLGSSDFKNKYQNGFMAITELFPNKETVRIQVSLLFVCLSVRLSVCLSVRLSVRLSHWRIQREAEGTFASPLTKRGGVRKKWEERNEGERRSSVSASYINPQECLFLNQHCTDDSGFLRKPDSAR